MRDNVFRRVVSSTVDLRLFKGFSLLPGFGSAVSTHMGDVSAVPSVPIWGMFLEDFVEHVGDESGQFDRCVLQKFAWNRVTCPVVVEPRECSLYFFGSNKRIR